MSKATEFCRRLFLLGGDLIDARKLLAELQNELLEIKGATEYEEFKKEIEALKPTFERVHKEFMQLFDAC